MRLIRGRHNFPKGEQSRQQRGLAATIGNFDGLHLGHQTMLARVRDISAQSGMWSGAFFFEPHPHEFFQPEQAPARLMLYRDKVEGLRQLGMDRVFMLRFDDSVRQMEPEGFVRDILLRAGVRHLVVGDDFRFGAGRSGGYRTLTRLGAELGMAVENTPTVQYQAQRVSSTRVRKALSDGEMELAASLLGRPWSYSGRVVQGRKMGRELGFPTANLLLPPQKLAVAGVYAVTVQLNDGHERPAVANVGIRPTFGQQIKVLEVHLLDFTGQLYRQRIRVSFGARLRAERKFADVQALKAQIAKDCDNAREYLR